MVLEEKIKASIVVGVDKGSLNKSLKSTEDDINGFKRRLNSSKGIQLANNLAQIRIKLQGLRSDLRAATTNKQRLEIQTNIEKVKKELTQANRELNNFARTGNTTKSKLGQYFDSIGNRAKAMGRQIVTAFAGLFAVQQIVGGIRNALVNASQLEDLQGSFIRLAGSIENADAILNRLRKSSRGTVSDIDLIRSANKALALGIGKDAEDIGVLLEVARLKGKAFGLDTQQAFNDIVTGLGRASPLILDNLGIVVDTKKANEEYAESIGKVASELNKAERSQALVNAVVEQGKKELEQAGDVALSTSDRWAQLTATTQNYLTVTGQGLIFFTLKSLAALDLFRKSIGIVIQVLSNSMFNVMSIFQDGINRLARTLSGSVNVFRTIGQNISSAFGSGLKGVAELAINSLISLVEGGINKLIDGAIGLLGNFGNLPGVRSALGSIGSISLGRVDFAGDFEVKSLSNAFAEGREQIAKSNNAVDAFKESALLLDDAINDVVESSKNLGDIKFGFDNENPVPLAQQLGLLDDEDILGGSGGGGSGKALTDTLDEIGKKRDEVFGKIKENQIKKLLDQTKDNFEDLGDTIEESIDKSKDNIKDLEDQIKSLTSELEKIDDEISSQGNKLLDRYVEIQNELREGDNDYATVKALKEELKLIEQNTDAEARREAVRVDGLSETEKILETIDALEQQKEAREAEIEALKTQKEQEQVILEEYQAFREQIEVATTNIVEAETRKRKAIIDSEIRKVKELIALQQQAGLLSPNAQAPSQSSVSNSNQVSQTFNTTINSPTDERRFIRDVADASKNSSLGYN